jgi:hypothetical protein
MHYLPQGGESSPMGSWGIFAPALPEVLTNAPLLAYAIWSSVCPTAALEEWYTDGAADSPCICLC